MNSPQTLKNSKRLCLNVILSLGICGRMVMRDSTLFYELPSDFDFDKEHQLKSTWLVCKHICIPGQAQVSFSVSEDGAVEIISFSPSEVKSTSPEVSELESRLSALPQESTDIGKKSRSSSGG